MQLGAGTLEVPLLRGRATDGRPAVTGRVVFPDGEASLLLLVDLAGSCLRIDPDTALALGLPAADEVILPELHVGDLVLREVPAAVGGDHPVLGLAGLPGAAAVVPSRGVVAIAPGSGEAELLASVGPEGKLERGDDGVLRAKAAARVGAKEIPGRVAIRTDLVSTELVLDRMPATTKRAGASALDAELRLADVWLADTWAVPVPAVPGDDDPLGVLGYDVAWAADLALAAGRERFAVAAAGVDRSQDVGPAAVAAARSLYDLAETRARPTGGDTRPPVEGRATIGFEGPGGRADLDPGNPVIRDRNRRFAAVLWDAGETAEALQRSLSAEQYAGPDCRAPLELGLRRMALTGTDRDRSDIVHKLVFDPLRTAAARADASLANGTDPVSDTAMLAAALAKRDVARCGQAWGILHRLAAPADATELERARPLDPWVAWSRILGAIDADRHDAARDLLVRVPQVARDHVLVAEIAIAAGTRDASRLDTLVRELPGTPTEAPLTTALGAWDALSGTPTPSDWTRKTLRADVRWVPGQILHALATGNPPPAWDPRREARDPADPGLAFVHAAHLAVSGELPAARAVLDAHSRRELPDWWAATALVAEVAGDAEARDAAVAELHARFPLLPAGGLGLGPR